MKKILVVNSDQNQGLLFKDELEKEGYEVLVSSMPEDSKEIIKNFHPDVIVLDIMIQSALGIKFLKSLKNLDEKIPLILCTDSFEYKAFQDGPKDIFVVRSSDIAGLKDALKRILFSTR